MSVSSMEGEAVAAGHANRVPLARVQTYRQAYTWSLVLQSVHVDHWLEGGGNHWLLSVDARDKAAAVGHIAAFERENRHWPPPVERPVGGFLFYRRQPPTLLIMSALLLVYWYSGPWTGGSSWFRAGAVNLERIVDGGQWWRLVTGLTLHADAVHLFSNMVIGGLVIHFLCKILGSGLGWSLVFAAGAAGNACNIVFRSGQHLSVGFSTAVFAAIGILSGLELKRKARFGGIVLPLGAGLSLLAMLGASGERTDLGAHFGGLAAGLLCGFVVAHAPRFLRWTDAWQRQLLFFSATILAIIGCWSLAFYR